MFKKILSLALAAVLAVSALASCGGSKEPVAADVPIDQLAQTIRDTYGEEYVCNMPIPAEMLEETYGIKADWVSEFVAEMPMIGFHVDFLIIVKPTEGSAENVKNALADYAKFYLDGQANYPANAEKAQSITQYSEGGYEFLFILGQIPMELEEEMYNAGKSQEEISAAKLEKAKENNQKAIDAVNALFFPEGK